MMPAPRQEGNRCLTLAGASLLILYADAVLRVIQGLFGGDGFGPVLSSVRPFRTNEVGAAPRALEGNSSMRTESNPLFHPRLPPQLNAKELAQLEVIPPHDAEHLLKGSGGVEDGCTRHELLLGNLYADLAPWVDCGLRVTEAEMARTINYVAEHRGKWNSWVTDTLTPVLIKGGKVYLTLGPPTKDPTNYFWTVLTDLQELARTHALPDVELLLNFADTPVVRATSSGTPSLPVPVFSYCKQEGFLDILVPGYYTPDRVCEQYKRQYNRAHRWEAKEAKAFARYTHFCKFTQQRDLYGRKLPPCSRSFFASIADASAGKLDVAPLNTVNDTTDPSLRHGTKLLHNGTSLPLSGHGRYK